MKDIDLAYIAGLVDGEGCIMITKENRLYTEAKHGYRFWLQVKITNTNKAVLEWVKDLFGGSVSQTIGDYSLMVAWN